MHFSKETVYATAERYLDKRYPDVGYSREHITKVNASYDGLSMFIKGDGEEKIGCAIDIDALCATADAYGIDAINSMIDEGIFAIRMRREQVKKINALFKDYSKASKRLFLKLNSLERNRQIADTCPFRKVADDLILTYHILLDPDDAPCNHDEIASTVVMDTFLDKWGITEDQLHEDAMTSGVRLFPEKHAPLSEVLGYDLENGLVVITNASNTFGAASALYPDVLKNVADEVQDDLLILPSSVHEVLALPATGKQDNVDDFKGMVMAINESVVKSEDRLSDSVYFFDRETGSLRKL